jgi:hypothetical protein
VLDPLRVWKGKDIIVDGMERHGIAEKHGLKYEVEYLEFPDREAVLVWMSKNQIAWRNTTKEQRDYHLGVYYNSKKKPLGDHKTSEGLTSEKVGEEAGVSGKTVVRAGKFATAVDAAAEQVPEVREALNQGKKITTKKLNEIAEAPTKNAAQAIAKTVLGGGEEEDKASEAVAPTGPSGPDPWDKPAPEPLPEPKKIYDSLNNLITDERMLPVFTDAEEFDAVLKLVRQAESRMKALSASFGGATLDMTIPLIQFKGLKSELQAKKPWTECKKCGRKGTIKRGDKTIECDPCLGLGFLDKYRFDVQQK